MKKRFLEYLFVFKGFFNIGEEKTTNKRVKFNQLLHYIVGKKGWERMEEKRRRLVGINNSFGELKI